MSSRKLTDRAVAALKPPATGRLEVWDATLPGFGLRITPTGKKTWCVMYRVGGRKRRHTIGNYPAVKLAQARELGSASIRAAAIGRDPAADKKQARSVRPGTFAELARAYIERHAKQNKRSWQEDEKKLELHILPTWASRRPEAITRADVIALLDDVEKVAPVGANRVRALLSKIFSWALEKNLLTENPVAGTKALARESQRDRVLSDAELAEVWGACDHLAAPAGDFVRVLILTGQRRSEVAGLRATDLDDADRPRLWTLPRELTKGDRAHEVPIIGSVGEILARLPRFSSGQYLFTTTAGKRPISGFSRAKKTLDETVLLRRHEVALGRRANAQSQAMPGWVLHDLRRTAASGMARLGFPPHVVAAVLNHAPASTQGITAIYNRHRYATEKRGALEAWAAHVKSIIESATTQKVRADREV